MIKPAQNAQSSFAKTQSLPVISIFPVEKDNEYKKREVTLSWQFSSYLNSPVEGVSIKMCNWADIFNVAPGSVTLEAHLAGDESSPLMKTTVPIRANVLTHLVLWPQ